MPKVSNEQLMTKLEEVSTQIEETSKISEYQNYSMFGLAIAFTGLIAYMSTKNDFFILFVIIGFIINVGYSTTGLKNSMKRTKRRKQLNKLKNQIQKTTDNVEKVTDNIERSTNNTKELVNKLKKK